MPPFSKAGHTFGSAIVSNHALNWCFVGRNHCSCTSVYFQEREEASRAGKMHRACFLSHSATPASSWVVQFDFMLPEFKIQYTQHMHISKSLKEVLHS